MTVKEAIEILIAYDNGKVILGQPNGFARSKHKDRMPLYEFIKDKETFPAWDFVSWEYRIKPEIKEKFLTVKELWGKTIIHAEEEMFLVASVVGDSINTIHGYTLTVDQLHRKGWKLATNDLTYETATSLKIGMTE